MKWSGNSQYDIRSEARHNGADLICVRNWRRPPDWSSVDHNNIMLTHRLDAETATEVGAALPKGGTAFGFRRNRQFLLSVEAKIRYELKFASSSCNDLSFKQMGFNFRPRAIGRFSTVSLIIMSWCSSWGVSLQFRLCKEKTCWRILRSLVGDTRIGTGWVRSDFGRDLSGRISARPDVFGGRVDFPVWAGVSGSGMDN